MDPQLDAWIKQLLAYVNSLHPEEREAYVLQACGDRQDLLEAVQAARSLGGTAAKIATGNRTNAQMIGPYRVLRELGKGGMGIVYLALRDDGAFRKNVAIKLLRGDAVTPEFVERFRNERQVLANFDHPNIARILDGGDMPDGMPYYVMEYVEGRSFDRYCDEEKLSVEDRIRLFQKLLSAIHYLHQNQVIHRDLKPSNVLVANDGTVKLLDFGIAKQLGPASLELTTAEGTPLTPAYASPEQFTGRADARSDIYTLGVILYLLLTGRLPDQSALKPPSEGIREDYQRTQETTKQLRKKMMGNLDAIVMKAMSREARIRYATAQEFGEDLERFLKGQAVRAAGGGSSGALHKVIGIAAAVALIGGATYFGMEFWKQRGSVPPTVPPTVPAAGQKSTEPPVSVPETGAPSGTPTPGGENPTRPAPTTPVSANPGSANAGQPSGGGRTSPPTNTTSSTGSTAGTTASTTATSATPLPQNPLPSTPPNTPAPAVVEGLEEARDRYASVAAKAAASESLVAKVKSDLEAKGLMIRPDTIVRVTSMKLALEQAKRDLDQGNVSGALIRLNAADAMAVRINKEFGR